MRLGFLGCGKWAAKLKSAFEAEGAVAVAHDRQALGNGQEFCAPYPKGGGPTCLACGGTLAQGPCHCTEYSNPAWGVRRHWQRMISDPNIDALVLCGPPDVTTEAALACAAAGKPVMATKPLMLTEAVPIRAPVYVDFWRLWSQAFKRFNCSPYKNDLEIWMQGSGPVRDFPGLLDYGPHALAYAHVLKPAGLKPWVESVVGHACAQGELFTVYGANGNDGYAYEIHTGNGAAKGERFIRGTFGNYGLLTETPEHMSFGDFREPKEEALRRMCRSFLSDISEGFVTTEHLDLSCAVMRDLAEVRRLADAATGSSAGHGAPGDPETGSKNSFMKQPAGDRPTKGTD